MDCWHNLIESSRTPSEVVSNATDYLALWSPNELAPITYGWREVRIESEADIVQVKQWLNDGLAGRLSASPSAGELRGLEDYLWHAAARLGELRPAAQRR